MFSLSPAFPPSEPPSTPLLAEAIPRLCTTDPKARVLALRQAPTPFPLIFHTCFPSFFSRSLFIPSTNIYSFTNSKHLLVHEVPGAAPGAHVRFPRIAHSSVLPHLYTCGTVGLEHKSSSPLLGLPQQWNKNPRTTTDRFGLVPCRPCPTYSCLLSGCSSWHN